MEGALRNKHRPIRVHLWMHTRHAHSTEPDAATKGQPIGWARWYDLGVMLLMFGRAPAMRERTAELANLKSGESVLEVGCGTGQLTQRARLRVGADGRVRYRPICR